MPYSLEKRKSMFIEKLNKRHNGEYTLVGEYVSSQDKTEFIHKVCGKKILTTPTNLLSANPGEGCRYCQYKRKSYSTSDIYHMVDSVSNGEFQLVEGQTYVNNREKMLILHKKCGHVFKNTWVEFRKYRSCPYCRVPSSTLHRKTTEQFKKELDDLYGGEYILADDAEYKGCNIGIHVIHTKCGNDWYPQPRHLLNLHGCPHCVESVGEKKVEIILNKLGVTYDTQHKFSDCVYKQELPFDFATIDDKGNVTGLIEYDGSQHYIPFEYFGGYKYFEIRKIRDSIKDSYCKENGIKLLRIPYTDNDEEIFNRINEFISEVKQRI